VRFVAESYAPGASATVMAALPGRHRNQIFAMWRWFRMRAAVGARGRGICSCGGSPAVEAGLGRLSQTAAALGDHLDEPDYGPAGGRLAFYCSTRILLQQ